MAVTDEELVTQANWLGQRYDELLQQVRQLEADKVSLKGMAERAIAEVEALQLEREAITKQHVDMLTRLRTERDGFRTACDNFRATLHAIHAHTSAHFAIEKPAGAVMTGAPPRPALVQQVPQPKELTDYAPRHLRP